MDRLSKWNGEKFVLPQGQWRAICDRLGAYEDTGLEPEEIMIMKAGGVIETTESKNIGSIPKADIINTLTTFKIMSDERFKDVFDAAIDAVNEYGRK